MKKKGVLGVLITILIVAIVIGIIVYIVVSPTINESSEESVYGKILKGLGLKKAVENEPIDISSENLGPKRIYPIKAQNLGSLSNYVMIQSLQGIIAKDMNNDQIYISDVRDFGYPIWLRDLERNYGYLANIQMDSWEFIDNFNNEINGYILYDNLNANGQNNSESLSVATSLAGLLMAVPITEDHESLAVSHNLTRVLDVRGKDEQWLFDNYGNQLNKDMFALQDLSLPQALRDWVSLNNMLTISKPTTSSLFNQVADSMNPNAEIYGWSENELEVYQILNFTKKGLRLQASNYANNFAILSQINANPSQKTSESVIPEGDERYVTFIMSDGDNISWILSYFMNKPNEFDILEDRYYRHPLRGEFNLGWSITPKMIELAPTVLKYIYDNATFKDNFVALSPGGYIYPDKYEDINFYVEESARLMQEADLKYLMSISNLQPDSSNLKTFCDDFHSSDQIKGTILYSTYDLTGWDGEIVPSNNKPCIGVRYALWNDTNNNNPNFFKSGQELADKINLMSTGLSNQDSYAIVYVNVWLNTLEDIQEAINNFDSNTRVVTPDRFMELVQENIIDNIYSDFFETSQINTDKWYVEDVSNSLSVQEGKLIFENSNSNARLNFQTVLDGDFDVQVDMENLVWTNPSSGNQYSILGIDFDANTYMTLQRGASNVVDEYQYYLVQNGQVIDSNTISVSSFGYPSKLRIIRKNNNLYAYLWDGSWRLIKETLNANLPQQSTTVNLNFQSSNELMKITVDNFVIKTENVVLPV
jgi:hypothetical protein